MKTNAKAGRWLPVITILILVAVWYLIALAVGAEIIIPMPHIVIAQMAKLFTQGDFYTSVLSSLWKILLSFLVAAVLGVGVAVLAAAAKPIESLFYPLLVVVRVTPTMSVIFLCLIWFSSKISPVIVSLMVIFPMFYSSCLNAIKGIDKKLIEMSRLYKVNKGTMIKRLYLPSVASKVYDDGIAILSLDVKLIISAEALAMTNLTLGQIMQISKANLETARLFAITVVAVLLSVILEALLKYLKKGAVKIIYAKNNRLN